MRTSGMDTVRNELYRRLVDGLDARDEIVDEELYGRIDRLLFHEGRRYGLSYGEMLKYRKLLFASLRGLDVLALPMEDPDVTEIMVNGPEEIWLEKEGRISRFDDRFSSPDKLGDVVQAIASRVNRRINEASPMVDARLSDGSRVNVVLPPVAIDGPCVTIRRFPENPMSMEDLVRIGSVTEECAEFLRKLVVSGYNIFISGGTGAGKTTFLGALAGYIPEGERVITIEDSAELRLRNVRNLVRLESRPANLEGEYEVTIRDLIRNALRMRPDRIIVGEIRGEEALDMLQAMNTGHDGSLSTGHANSAEDMLSRIETMVLMGKELPIQAVRKQIASAIDIFVHLSRLRDRTRKVTGIYEVAGIRDGEVALDPLYEFRETGEEGDRVEGTLVRTGELQHTAKLFARHGRL